MLNSYMRIVFKINEHMWRRYYRGSRFKYVISKNIYNLMGSLKDLYENAY